MFVVDILFALVVASLLTGVFYLGRSGRAGRWATASSVAVGIAFALWLSGIWLTPAGPVIWVSHWFSYVFVLVLVLMLASILAPRRSAPPPASGPSVTSTSGQQDMFAVTLFFSLSALLFVTLIAVRFV